MRKAHILAILIKLTHKLIPSNFLTNTFPKYLRNKSKRKRKECIDEFVRSINNNIIPLNRHENLFYSLGGGEIKANYANRFMQITFEYFASVMLDKDIKDISEKDLKDLSSINKGREYIEARKVENFKTLFEETQNRFFDNYKKQLAEYRNLSVIKTIEEEISHNKFVKDTPSSVFCNALTVYYRICSCYLTYYRSNTSPLSCKNENHQITCTLINIYLIRSIVNIQNYSIVEASYHYLHNLEQVQCNYGKHVTRWCKDFLEIYELFFERVGLPTKAAELTEAFQKTLLSYRFMSIIDAVFVLKEKLSYVDFCEIFSRCGAKYNNPQIIKEKIKNKDVTIEEIEGFIEEIQSERQDANGNVFRDVLVFLLASDFSSRELRSFLWGRVPKSKNLRALLQMFIGNNYLGDFPSVRCFGINDEFFNIDEAMISSNFEGEDFIIAQNSFEPTLLGDDGFHDIANSKYCNTLLIQNLLIKAIEMIWRLEKKIDVGDFIKETQLCFETRPYARRFRTQIEVEILPSFLLKAIDFFYTDGDQVEIKSIDITFAQKFEESILYLYEKVESLSEEVKKPFYAFCEQNYTHGY